MTMVPVDQQAAVLKAIGLDPRNPLTQALVMVANRYGLDPILKQIYIIRDQVYISRDGLLHIAHASGDLDGIEVEVEEFDAAFMATAKVWRKSMSRPFVYSDKCLKSEKVQDARKRAITRAERNALRRAFDVVDVYDEPPERTVVMSTEAPPLPGEIEAPTPYDYRPLIITCREMKLTDDVRHDIVKELTNGRTESVKEMYPHEVVLFKRFIEELKTEVDIPQCSSYLEEVLRQWRRSVSETET